jgi:hypothetical protein
LVHDQTDFLEGYFILIIFLPMFSLLQSQSEIEQEKDNLLAEVESGRMKIHALEQAIDEMTARVAEKVSLFHLTVYSISLVAENQQEKDITCRVQAAVDDEVHHCTELVQEKLQLEAHIAELERAAVEQQTAHQSNVKQLEEQLRLIENGKVFYCQPPRNACKGQLLEAI